MQYCSLDNDYRKVGKGHYFTNQKGNPEKKSIDCALDAMKGSGYNFICSREIGSRARSYGVYRNEKTFLKCHSYLMKNECLYEVLPASLPRYFYADLDRKKHKNEHVNVLPLITAMRKAVKSCYKEVFGGDFNYDDIGIWESCRSTKVSFHFRFPFAFANQYDCKQFSKVVLQKCLSMKELCYSHDGAKSTVFDINPYSNNQNFRLPGQCKWGKASPPLKPFAGDCSSPFLGIYSPKNVTFMDSSRLEEKVVQKRKIRNVVSSMGGKSTVKREGTWDVFSILREPEEPVVPNYDGDHFDLIMSCIPNYPPQEYEVWIAVGMALKNEDSHLDLWIDWTNKAYDEDQSVACLNQWRGFKKTKNGYGMAFLRKLAKAYVPEFDDAKASYLINQVMGVSAGKMKCHRYNEQYVLPYEMSKYKYLVEKSAMGTGKTYAIKQYIKFKKPRRIIYLSPRIVFSRNIEGIFKEFRFTNYKDKCKTKDLSKIPRLICSMESLCKIEYDPQYDLVVLDEIETLLNTLSSPTVKDKGATFEVFCKMLRKSTKVVMMDAFISNRTLDFVRSIENERKVLLRINEFVPEARKAICLSKKMLTLNVEHQLKEGKRIVFFTASKRYGDTLERLAQRLSIKYKYYHKDTSDRLVTACKDTKHEWEGVQFLIYTPKITVGVNHDVIDAFDCLFVYGVNMSCLARDVIQATMRVRHIKEKTMFICTSQFTCEQRKCDREAIREILRQKNVVAQDLFEKGADEELSNDFDFKEHMYELDPILREIIVHNMQERNISYMHYKEMIATYLHSCNYTITERTDEKTGDKDVGNPLNYHEVKDITKSEYGDIWDRVNCCEATETEKNQLRKYEMKHFLRRGTDDKVFEFFWQTVWCNNEHVGKLNRIRREVKDKECGQLRTDVAMSSGEVVSSVDLTQPQIHKLCGLLGLDNSIDQGTVVPHAKMNNIFAKVKEIGDTVTKFCTLRSRQTNKYGDASQCKALVNKLLGIWSGSKLVVAKTHEVLVNGKRTKQYDLKIQPAKCFHGLPKSVIEYL